MNIRKVGALVAAWASLLLLPGMLHAGTASYRYDALSRLVQVAYADGRTFAYSYDSAGNRIQTTAPGKAAQIIAFAAPPTVVAGATAILSATGGASGNPVTFTSQTTGVCTVSGTNGSTVTGVAIGTCTIAANQAGNANHNAAAPTTQSFSIGKANQAITFGALPTILRGGTGTVMATGGTSGNPVTFTSQTTAVCTSAGTNGSTITGVTVGTCTIAANQAGTANYNAAAQVTQTITVGKGNQIVAFGTAPTVVAGGTGTVSATGGASGNPVTFSSTTPAACTVSGTNGSTVAGVAVGTCTIAANQAGNANYNAAVQVTQSITVGKGNQTVAFGTAPTVVAGGTSTVSATGGASGNPVIFTSQTTGVCTTGGTNGSTVTGVAIGTCTIAANQAGSASFNAAAQVTQRFSIAAPNQTNRPPVADAGTNRLVSVGESVALDASASIDPDGDTLAYLWQFVSIPAGSAATLSGPTRPNPTLVIDVPGLYVVELTVSDAALSSAPATVVLSTENTAPQPLLGVSQLVRVGSSVRLDGDQSVDPEGADLTWSWSFAARPANSAAVIAPADSSTPTFVADQAGRYVARLGVSDGALMSAPAEVSVNTVTGDVDIDLDQVIDVADQRIVESCLGRPDTQQGCQRADLNGDHVIDTGDLEIIAYALVHAAPTTDLTNDGQVDTADRNALRACLLAIPSADPSCGLADLNGDDYVDGLDEAMLMAFFNTGGYRFLRPFANQRFVVSPNGLEVSLDRLLVQFRSGATRAEVDATVRTASGAVGGFLGADVYVVNVNAADYQALSAIMATLEASPLVRFTVPGMLVELSGFSSDLDGWYGRTRLSYDTVLAERAWELAEMIRATRAFQHTTIGMVDAPVDAENWDFKGVDIRRLDSFPPHDHGTAVAGIIAANNGTGDLTGIATGAIGAKLSLKAIGGTRSVILAGTKVYAEDVLYWINKVVGDRKGPNGANVSVVNLSISLPKLSRRSGVDFFELREMVEMAVFKANPRVLFVIAAGNDGKDVADDAICAPLDNTLIVGGVKANGIGTDPRFNWGSGIGINAPAVDVEVIGAGVSIRTDSGTSFAAPMVTGAAAILQSLNPSLASNPAATKQALINAADHSSSVGKVLNVCRAIHSQLSAGDKVAANIPTDFCSVGNGGFEDSVPSWYGMGDSTFISGLTSTRAITPRDGRYMNLLRSNGATIATAAEMEQTLGLPADSISAALGGSAKFGSLTFQSIPAREADQLTFQWDFIRGGLNYTSHAFYVLCKVDQRTEKCATDSRGQLDGVIESLATNAMATQPLSDNSILRHTGWREKQIVIDSTAERIFAVGIINVDSNFGAHLLTVDRVQLRSNL